MKALLQWFFFVEEQYYSSVDRISRKGKVGKYLPLINTSHDTISENFQNYSETETCNKKKTFTHSSTCVLSFLPFFFLTHRHVRTHSLAAVGPLSGDQRQSLDPTAPRWGQKLGQASTETASPCAARNTVLLSAGPERVRSLIQSWQQRAPLQPPTPSLTPAAPFPACWHRELTWKGRGC